MRAIGRLLLAVLLGIAVPGSAVGQDPEAGSGWTKTDKALALNLAAGGAVLGWGAWTWNWGSLNPGFKDEGWFGRDTMEGGADKLGHFWTGYALSHLFAYQYRRWDFDNDAAIRLGALSSLGVMGLVEVGDAFSEDYGFSVQDALFDAAGAAVGYALWQNPELARKIDLRIEYNPFLAGDYQLDVFTDYDRLRYLIAIKADGFDAVTNPLLRLLELHVGFYARNYADYDPDRGTPDQRERHFYVGVGLNVTRLIQPYWDTGVFRYIQVPYTYLPYDRRLD